MINLQSQNPVNLIWRPQPVNMAHPLNRGRIAWWLPINGLIGGNTLYDLMGLNSGALANMGTGYGWSSNSPNQFQSLLFNGSTSSVLGTSSPIFDFTTQLFTVMCDIYPLSVSVSNPLFNNRSPTGSVSGWYFIQQSNAALDLTLVNTGIHQSSTAAAVVVANKWQRVVAVRNSSTTALFYINGKSVATSTNSISNAAANTGNPWYIGISQFGTAVFDGYIAEVSIWNRPLSAMEVQNDYILGQTGYSGVLNRVGFMSDSKVATTSVLFRRGLYNRTGSRGIENYYQGL